MKEFRYKITDPEGLHARPAGLLIKLTIGFASAISIEANGKTADAKRIFGIMGLGVKQGQEIKIIAQGSDEEDAIVEIEKFLKETL